MVQLHTRKLDAMSHPVDDMVGVVGVDLSDVVDPLRRFGGVTRYYRRWAVLVEHPSAGLGNPAAFCHDEPVADDFWVPRHHVIWSTARNWSNHSLAGTS